MNLADLTSVVAEANTITRKEASELIKSIFTQITVTLKKGEVCTLVGFGTFESKQRIARIGRNPKTGAAIAIPAHYVPVFRAGNKLKVAVNSPT